MVPSILFYSTGGSGCRPVRENHIFLISTICGCSVVTASLVALNPSSKENMRSAAPSVDAGGFPTCSLAVLGSEVCVDYVLVTCHPFISMLP
jgi:hypothetical protein